MHLSRRLSPLLPFFFGILLLAPSCSGGPEKGKDQEKGLAADPRSLVESAEIGRADIADYIVSSGTIESERQADLSPETNGLVTSIHVEEGEPVRKGQLLAVIENPNLDASLSRAKEQLDQAQRAHDETLRLLDAGATSPKQLQDARSALDLARTAWNEAKGVQAFTRITSPIEGTVSFRDLRYGEIAIGGKRAFQVVDLDRLRVVVSLPEKDLPRVRVGQRALLIPSSQPETRVPALVQRIGPVVDPATGTFRVTVQPETDALKPGQFVSVSIEVDQHPAVLAAPRRALVWDEGEPFLFRVEPAPPEEKKDKDEDAQGEAAQDKPWYRFSFGKKDKEPDADMESEIPGPRRVAKKVPVLLGFVEADRVELIEGELPPGASLGESPPRPVSEADLVVIVGQETLRDGARVRLPEDPVWKPKEKDKEKDEADNQ